MNVRTEVLEILRHWVRKAEHDLEAARRIMAEKEDCPFDTACFHCQQAIEKYVKCLLTLSGIPAPRTHDIGELARLIPTPYRLSVPLEQLVELNQYAVDVRYADDLREPRLDEAERAFGIAERVRAEVRALLPAAAL